MQYVICNMYMYMYMYEVTKHRSTEPFFFTTYGVSLATAMDCRVSLLDAWEAIEAETATINVPGQFFKAMPHFPIGFSI